MSAAADSPARLSLEACDCFTKLALTPVRDFPTLETRRVWLRELTAADAPRILEIYGSATAMRHFGTAAMKCIAEAEVLIDMFASWRTAANPGVRWAIECKTTGVLLGSCGLFGWNREWSKCTTVYDLVPAARGQGIVHEAMRVALSWGFDNMMLNRVEAQIHPDNTSSIAVAERLGFQREGRMRQLARWNGSFHDMLQFALLRSDRPAAVA